MPISLPKFYTRLALQLRKRSDFQSDLSSMFKWCSEHEPHPVWSHVSNGDVEREAKAARDWMPRVLASEPCNFPVRGIYFGLGEYQSKRVEYADLYFGLHGQCDPADIKTAWLWQGLRHYPGNARLKSKVLKSGGLLCNSNGTESGLSTAGYISFSVSFATLLLCHVLDRDFFRQLGETTPIGIVTGFDSGDLIRLGLLAEEGLSITEGKIV